MLYLVQLWEESVYITMAVPKQKSTVQISKIKLLNISSK